MGGKFYRQLVIHQGAFMKNVLISETTDKRIKKEIIISASVNDVWESWTTLEGVKSFFAPQAEIELSIGGKYEMYFLLKNPPGLRGGEGCKILSFLPKQMLSFSWNAPPQFPQVRQCFTWVVLLFTEITPQTTKITLTQLGWQSGSEWEKVYEYFNNAWEIVLKRLEQRFVQGPIRWDLK